MNPKKFRNYVEKPSETAETAAALCSTRHRHWQRVGSRADADEGNKTGRSGTYSLLCLPTLSVRTTITCNKGNNAQTSIDFNFSFYVGSFSGLLLCSGLLFFPSSSNGRSGGYGRSVGSWSCGFHRWGKGQQ